MLRRRNMAAIAVAFVFCWALLQGAGRAQLNSKPQDETVVRLGARIEDFLGEVANDNVDSAVDTLLARSPLLKDAKKVGHVKESIRREMPKYGAYMGVEQLKLERIGRSIVRGVYIYHCLDYPVAWTMTFYRSEEEGDWSVISLQFNVDYDKLPGAE